MKENKDVKALLKLMRQLGLKEADRVYKNRFAISNMLDVLKELYSDDQDFMKDLFYSSNLMFQRVHKSDIAGGYVAVPIISNKDVNE
jgi:hypothetical protein